MANQHNNGDDEGKPEETQNEGQTEVSESKEDSGPVDEYGEPLDEEEHEHAKKRPVYKRPAFLIGGAIILLIALFAGYEAAGPRVEPSRVRFWEVMGTLRWGVMCCGMMQRFRLGPDHSMERAMIGRRCSETEIDLLRLLAPRGA